MSYLKAAFTARDTLREALGIQAAIIYRKTQAADVLVLQAPAENPSPASGPYLSFVIYSPGVSDPVTCLPTHIDMPEKHFSASRKNMIGYLGLPGIPTVTQRIDDDCDKWLDTQLAMLVPFHWIKVNEQVWNSGPLYPSATNSCRATLLKVYFDKRKDLWTWDLIHKSKPDATGEHVKDKNQALDQATKYAIRYGHFPIKHTPIPRVIAWTSTWPRIFGYSHEREMVAIHEAILHNGAKISMREFRVPQPRENATGIVTFPNPQDKHYLFAVCNVLPAHGYGTPRNYYVFSSKDEALDHAFDLVKKELATLST